MPETAQAPCISLLTAGKDPAYARGLARALTGSGCELEFVGSDLVNPSGLPNVSRIRFFNLRGDQRNEAGLGEKTRRIVAYYWKLVRYAALSKPRIFHILWVNKIEWFDETVLMLYYRLLGKKICFTAHNVNKAKRDGHDSAFNRLALRIQYSLCHHIFVHTRKMKAELVDEFKQPEVKISLIPLGIYDGIPTTSMTGAEARARLGFGAQDRVLLFFGNIAPYKGLEFLVEAFNQLAPADTRYRLVIAGSPKGPPGYWAAIRETLRRSPVADRVLQVIEYVPDEQTELYFKAADVAVLPYTHIFQSGVLLMNFTFGLPVIAADVGSLNEDVIEGMTGLIFKPRDVPDLVQKIQAFFESDLYRNRDNSRQLIQAHTREKYSWDKVAATTTAVYARLAG